MNTKKSNLISEQAEFSSVGSHFVTARLLSVYKKNNSEWGRVTLITDYGVSYSYGIKADSDAFAYLSGIAKLSTVWLAVSAPKVVIPESGKPFVNQGFVLAVLGEFDDSTVEHDVVEGL